MKSGSFPKYYYILVAIVFSAIIYMVACLMPSDTKKAGMSKCSQSISESKQNGVFQHALRVSKHVINFGENQRDTIQEAWSERRWMYNEKEEIVKDSDNQMLIVLSHGSKEFNDKGLLGRKDHTFGWNGPFIFSYDNQTDTIYAMSSDSVSKKFTDTIIVFKPE